MKTAFIVIGGILEVLALVCGAVILMLMGMGVVAFSGPPVALIILILVGAVFILIGHLIRPWER